MKITYDGLIAGVRFLSVHCEGFCDGTGDDFQTWFIRDLLSEVFRASGITPEMPDQPPGVHKLSALAGCQDKLRLLAFLVGPDGEHLTVEVDCR